MKTANFTYTGTPQRSTRVETITGTVTLKNDGKISISLNSYGSSYAAKFQAKNLAKAIVEADFNHTCATNLKVVETGGLLYKLIKEKTEDLRVMFIQRTKEYVVKDYGRHNKFVKTPIEVLYDRYGLKWEKRNNSIQIIYKDLSNSDKSSYYRLQDSIRESETVIKKGFTKFLEERVAKAEKHYQDSLGKLTLRLHDRGITDADVKEVTSQRIGVNFECYVFHKNGVVRAWTIIAEGPIQQPHYRYLIK